jgi:hypothetical protein
MRRDDKIRIDEERLRQYQDMKPAATRTLRTTARITAKLMWAMLRFAFRLPGMIKRSSSRDHTLTARKKS